MSVTYSQLTKKEIKVAKIIDDTSIVINAGENQGIQENDKFQIIGKLGSEPVIDPDTKESLGTLDDIKATVIAQDIFPNMTVCRSKYIKEEINGAAIPNAGKAGFARTIKQLQNGILSSGHYESLNVDEQQITGGFKKSNTPIQIGDIARKIN